MLRENRTLLNLKQASNTRQVLEAKGFRQVPVKKSKKAENSCQPTLEYQELISAPWGVFIVDQLG